MTGVVRIVCISDTHTKHDALEIPECDVLVCAGDITWRGEAEHVASFAYWASKQPAKRRILIAGNHDWNFADTESSRLSKAVLSSMGVDYLQDSGVEIDGVKFWGSPWQPEFCNWAFNLPRGAPLAEKWALIPNDTDVLITHGPPYGILDSVDPRRPLGCKDLRKRVNELDLRLHVFGHIHASYGRFCSGSQSSRTTYVNASSCNESYMPVNEPILYEREDWTRGS